MSRPAYPKVILSKSLCCAPINMSKSGQHGGCPHCVIRDDTKRGIWKCATMVNIAGGREPDNHMPAPEAPHPKSHISHSHDQPQRW